MKWASEFAALARRSVELFFELVECAGTLKRTTFNFKREIISKIRSHISYKGIFKREEVCCKVEEVDK